MLHTVFAPHITSPPLFQGPEDLQGQDEDILEGGQQPQGGKQLEVPPAAAAAGGGPSREGGEDEEQDGEEQARDVGKGRAGKGKQAAKGGKGKGPQAKRKRGHAAADSSGEEEDAGEAQE